MVPDRAGNIRRLYLEPDQKVLFHCEDGFITYKGKVGSELISKKGISPAMIDPTTGDVTDSIIKDIVCS